MEEISMDNHNHFFGPLKSLSFDLRDKNLSGFNNASNILKRTIGLQPSWKSLTHNQLLNVIAGQLGYLPHEAKTAWKTYVDTLDEYFNRIDIEYKNLNLTKDELLFNEDRASIAWYMHLRRKERDFIDRLDLLQKYIQVRDSDFVRCKIKNLQCFGLNFDPETSSLDFSHDTNKHHSDENRSLMEAIEDDLCKLNNYNSGCFFKNSMGWLYLYDSSILYCTLAGQDFRNAICHNVDFRYSSFSLEGAHADLMGADFSFCDCSNVSFMGCYAREAKFYKTTAKKAVFDKLQAIGALFIKSDLENASFQGARLRNVSFRGSNLKGANFKDAYVSGVDCRGADLRDVVGLDINTVYIDEHTQL